MGEIRPVRHDKTGKIYMYLNEVVDATNSENNKVMILYCNMEGESFVREKREFWYKFSSISTMDVSYTPQNNM